VAQSKYACGAKEASGTCGNSRCDSPQHATTGSPTMYRAHGTRIMTVHANHPALRSPRIPSMLAHPQKYKDVPWSRWWSCRFVSLVVTYTPTFALLYSCCQSAPRGVVFLFTTRHTPPTCRPNYSARRPLAMSLSHHHRY
jgi:hypothetical protein